MIIDGDVSESCGRSSIILEVLFEQSSLVHGCESRAAILLQSRSLLRSCVRTCLMQRHDEHDCGCAYPSGSARHQCIMAVSAFVSFDHDLPSTLESSLMKAEICTSMRCLLLGISASSTRRTTMDSMLRYRSMHPPLLPLGEAFI